MIIQKSKRLIVILVCMIFIVNFLGGCKGLEENISNNLHTYDEFITVDVFSSQANYQGIQGGWFGEIIKNKFNMEINIIAPNVSGGGDILYQTRSAAGNLGDIIIIDAENGLLNDTIKAGLLMDISPFKDIMPYALQYSKGIKSIQQNVNNTENIYALPSGVTSYLPTDPSEAIEPTFGPYLRWDLYTQIGAPVINSLEDLLVVLKEIQLIYPLTDSGQKTYAFSLFKDWDDNMMMMAKQPACFYGYDEVGFLLSKVDGSHDISILENDSPYIRSLKWYFDANQLGLVDPDSITQNWEDVWNKYVNGVVTFSPWPWLGQSAYNTVENLNEGKGFMLAPMKDAQLLSYGATTTGTSTVIGIGSKSNDPARMAAFIDWLYSPEGIMMGTSQTGSSCGPEGLTWSMVDGRPVLTEFGVEAMLKGGTIMPDEWGGGDWNNGISQLNFKAVLEKDINPLTGYSYNFRLWESYLEFTRTPLHESWQDIMDASTTFEYLETNQQLIVDPGNDFVSPEESSYISTLRSQCKLLIVEKSWDMIFAKNDEEFYNILKETQKAVEELGYEEVIAFDLISASLKNIARDKARLAD